MFTFILTMLVGHAPASAGARVDCEHYLHGSNRIKASRELQTYVMGSAFTLTSHYPVTERAEKRLGFARHLDKQIKPATLVAFFGAPADATGNFADLVIHDYRNGAPREFMRRGFPDATPVLWRTQVASKLVWSDVSDSLLTRPTVRTGRGELIDTFPIGLVTDPAAADGVRTYVRANYDREEAAVWLELGLDVPCADLALYLDPAGMKRHLWQGMRTSTTEYCRVPALSFSYVRLTAE